MSSERHTCCAVSPCAHYPHTPQHPGAHVENAQQHYHSTMAPPQQADDTPTCTGDCVLERVFKQGICRDEFVVGVVWVGAQDGPAGSMHTRVHSPLSPARAQHARPPAGV
jgi:hypothetical protein